VSAGLPLAGLEQSQRQDRRGRCGVQLARRRTGLVTLIDDHHGPLPAHRSDSALLPKHIASCEDFDAIDLLITLRMLGAVAGASEAAKDVERYIDVVLRGLRPS
jgi:hypothetical protein